MTDNPSYRGGGQGPAQPGDDYYEYGRQGDEPRAPYPPAPEGGYPPAPAAGQPPQPAGGYPEQGGYDRGGYPDQGYPPPSYDQRSPSGYGPRPVTPTRATASRLPGTDPGRRTRWVRRIRRLRLRPPAGASPR